MDRRPIYVADRQQRHQLDENQQRPADGWLNHRRGDRSHQFNIVIDGAASGQLRRTTIGLTANAASVLNTVWIQTFTPRGNGNGTISLEYDPSNANNVWATIQTSTALQTSTGRAQVMSSGADEEQHGL
jgi:hypothetical protein